MSAGLSGSIDVDAIQKELANVVEASKSSKDAVTNAAFEKVREVGSKAISLDTFNLSELAKKAASPLLGVAASFLFAKAMDLAGHHQTTLADIAKVLGEVKALQEQTLDLLKDVQAQVQSLASADAEFNLVQYLRRLEMLAGYTDPNSYEAERIRIKKGIEKDALKDLQRVHTALIGEGGNLDPSVKRDGILRRVYNKLEKRLQDDRDFTAQMMAEALDKHFVFALIFQWYYFNLFTSHAVSDRQRVDNQLKGFLEDLETQRKLFKSLQPPALDYLVHDEKALGVPPRQYHLRHHDDPRHTLWEVVDYSFLQRWHNLELIREDEAEEKIRKAERSGYPGVVTNRWWIRDRDIKEGMPPKTTINEADGPGGRKIPLESPLEYFGSGFVTISQWNELGWPDDSSGPWRVHKREEGEILRLPTFKILPVKEPGANAEKVLVSLWDTRTDRRLNVNNKVDKVFELYPC